MKTKKGTGILGKLIVALALIVALFTGGYFLLDRYIVPKYFGDFGIKNLSALVNVMGSLYSSPNESTFITNGYTENDLTSAIKIMQASNYNIEDDGTIPTNEPFKGDLPVELTDRELAAVCNKMLENGLLSSTLTNLNLNLITMSVLQITITPKEASKVDDYYDSATIEFIIKVNTTNIREQIAEQMQTPLFLLNMIIPDELYFSFNYLVDLSQEDNYRTTGTIAINGRTAEQSEVLINLLIDFIFPEGEEMDLEKFTYELGDVALQGIDEIGNFKFAKNVHGTTLNGIFAEATAQDNAE